jgi:pyruvate/2-oxoglutarate dehydrogenase complex dihydrolipoamide acyltransferase (E2) component
MESHEDIERLLPVTSWRSWLAAIAGLLLIVAALLYAAADSRQVTVTGEGRVADGYGIRLVTSTAAGQLASFNVIPGQKVEKDQIVAHVQSGNALVPQHTANAGRIIGLLWRPGDAIDVGTWLLEVAASESDGKQALIALDPGAGSQVAEGQSVEVTVLGALGATTGTTVPGKVVGVSEPLRAAEVEVGLALLEPPTGKQVVAVVSVDTALEPGSIVRADIIVSERNLLQQLLGLS